MIKARHIKHTFLGSLLAVSAYSTQASAAVRTCAPTGIVEASPRMFQVYCSNGDDDGAGGVPEVFVYRAGTTSSAENEALAARFQAIVTAAILSGRYIRADMSNDATLCTGLTDCMRANWWALWPTLV